MHTIAVRELADIVATKLGIILFPSFHLLFSQKGFANDFEFLQVQKKEDLANKNWAHPPFSP